MAALLLDENMPRSAGRALAQAGHDVLHVADIAPATDDRRVLARARAACRILVACDDLQLAAQALCLQEMTGRTVAAGALFYATGKRRRVVPMEAALLAQVEVVADAVRAMLASGRLPPPTADTRRCHASTL